MKKILVIEDEAPIRDNISELLKAEEFEVLGAEDGAVGVKLAIEHLPDLILCDVMMPILDGYGVLSQLRQNPLTATIPFIFLTSLADRSHLRMGMELGADDYLAKPCTANELLKAIVIRLEKQFKLQERYTATQTQLLESLQVAEERLRHLLYYDSLTNLPNRLSLRDRFQQILTASNLKTVSPPVLGSYLQSSSLLSILYLGFDRFNRINDSWGYESGDLILKAAAERIVAQVGTELSTVAYLNADEFAIILAPVESKKAVGAVAQNILNTLSQPFALGSREVFITASIGIALCPRDGRELETLLRQTYKAMKYAKQQGGNRYEFYQPIFHVDTTDQLALEVDLRRALDREEFQLHYQPQVELKTGRIVSAEALLRWHHSERGIVSPAKFIPIAEETGLIESIGEWVLNTACQQIKAWQSAGLTSLRVAVNLSGRQFNQIDIRQRLVRILMDKGIGPEFIELELTESILVENVEVAIRRLKAFKDIGLKIAIDDFGTGYSSLSYLQQFPFDILKIDQCFVRDINKNAKNTAITAAIIQMAHQMNIKAIAEGVETEAELNFLREHHCDAIQGYLFSRPLPTVEFEKLVGSGRRLPIQS
ncbi:MAG: putative bifunctional diguanylate cyclase/phosphodiesterase [Actinomycetota bacterium]